MKTLTTTLSAFFLLTAIATGCEEPEGDCAEDQGRTENRSGALSIDVDTDKLNDAIDVEEDCTPPLAAGDESVDGFDEPAGGFDDEGPVSDGGPSDDDWSDYEDGDWSDYEDGDWSDYEDGDWSDYENGDWFDEGCDSSDEWSDDWYGDDCGCECYGDEDYDYWY